MKTNLFLSLVFVVMSIGSENDARGQSTFRFNNRDVGLDAPVFDSAGNRLSGTNYVAMLYGGPTIGSLALAWDEVNQPFAPVPFTFGEAVGQSGYFARSGYVQIGNVGCGAPAWLQVRAWDARLGASYEDTASLNIGGYGESGLFQWVGGNPCLGVPSPPERLVGLQSFALREVIPEPTSTLLLLLGLPALLLFRRHRSK